jgi:hypothetical protein
MLQALWFGCRETDFGEILGHCTNDGAETETSYVNEVDLYIVDYE